MRFNPKVILLAAAAAIGCAAQAAVTNPMTQAVIRTYDRMISANPADYATLFRRANEYYRHSDYSKALDDANACLRYAPLDNSDGIRFQALMLRAGIYSQTNRPAQAYSDLTSALALEPQAMQALYQRALSLLELGRYTEARDDFRRIQAREPRNVDALIGLARVAAAQGDFAYAASLLEQSAAFSANDPESYVQRAEVRRRMADHRGAIDDLLTALALGKNNRRATRALVDYADTNYEATIDGLTRAIQAVPRNGLYRYLRATIAQSHYNYVAALADLNTILEQQLYSYHGLQASVARCELALGRYEEALDHVGQAIKESAGSVAEYYVLRSQILRALGQHDQAIAAANNAVVINREYVPGLVEMALNYVDKKDYEQAATLLGEASMIDASNPEVYILRAWIHETYLNQPVAAAQFYAKAAEVEGFADDDVASLRGFALARIGRGSEGDSWMERILAGRADHDGRINYLASCYWMMRGNDDKALACVEAALKAGYSDNHAWMHNADGPVNAGALRDDLRFLRLMQQYNSIFGN